MTVHSNPVLHLVNTLKAEGEVLIFLGAGSSVEGWQGAAPFPDFSTLIGRVLTSEGRADADNRMAAFLDIMRQWERESTLSVRLGEYLYGSPGTAHLQLASATMSLFPELNMTTYLTTNFDDLMFKAFSSIAKNAPHGDPRAFSLKKYSVVSELTGTFDAISGHAKKGAPVILKLFGDLSSTSPIFHPDDMPFDEFTEQKLAQLFNRPAIFVGYGLNDGPILRLLASSRSKQPIFVVAPVNPIKDLLATMSQRQFHWISKGFGDFISDFIEISSTISPNFKTRFAEYFRVAEAQEYLDSPQSLRALARTGSSPALARHRNRVRPDDASSTPAALSPIARPDTGPDISNFRASDARILAIVGESGSGKSTLLNQIYEDAEAQGQDLCFYYDAHSLHGQGALRSKLSLDLMAEPFQLEKRVAHIGQTLGKRGHLLFVLIDALNESPSVDPLALRYEIEALAAATPDNVRFIYTCRRVFWDAHMDPSNDLPLHALHDRKPFLLGRFSPAEAEVAYGRHQQAFSLQPEYAALSATVRQHLRDPLMLRIMAEAYRGSALPHFAPAAIVFKRVMNAFRRRYRHAPLVDYLECLVDGKIDQLDDVTVSGDIYSYREARTNGNLALLAQQQIASGRNGAHPLEILEDENIISALDLSHSQFKFTYERFYEYVIGVRINDRLAARGHDGLVEFLEGNVQKYRSAHYSFYQGLRNAFVIRYLGADLPLRLKIAALVRHPDASVAAFGRDVLREVIFEADMDALEALSVVDVDRVEQILLLLDLGFEAEEAIPYAIDGLFQPDLAVRRRSASCLLVQAKTYGRLDQIAQKVNTAIRSGRIATEALPLGIVLFGAVLISAADSKEQGLEEAASFISSLLDDSPRIVEWEPLVRAVALALESEGPLFFGANYDADGVLYPWRQHTPEFDRLRRGIPLLFGDTLIEALEANFEAVLFFSNITLGASAGGASQRLFAYQIEYRIVQWLVIRAWNVDEERTLGLLERIVEQGGPFNIDFALGIIEHALFHDKNTDRGRILGGLDRMKSWIERFEASPTFFLALQERDPFAFNLVPLAVAARVDAAFLTAERGVIATLANWLADPSPQRRKMAYLAANWLSAEFPIKVLATLEPFLHRDMEQEWLDRVLSAYQDHSPRLLDEFLEEMHVPILRRVKIRGHEAAHEAQSIQYKADDLFSWLFLGPMSRLRRVGEIYGTLYEPGSCESAMSTALASLLGRSATAVE